MSFDFLKGRAVAARVEYDPRQSPFASIHQYYSWVQYYSFEADFSDVCKAADAELLALGFSARTHSIEGYKHRTYMLNRATSGKTVIIFDRQRFVGPPSTQLPKSSIAEVYRRERRDGWVTVKIERGRIPLWPPRYLLYRLKRRLLAAKKTGKLLQIGHQRRSNPRYKFCFENLIKGAKLLGQITAVNGQWNRRASEPIGWPKNAPIDPAVLKKYGYASMEQFKNWRWYEGLGGGPMVDLGSHQIDIYNWFLQAAPKSVIASGRTNFYDPQTHEWPDTMMAVYEYETAQGNVTAFYQTISSSASGGYFENFMGNQGSLVISERSNRCEIYRDERTAPKWDQWVKDGLLYKQCDCEIDYIEKAKKESIQKCGCPQIGERTTGAVLDLRETPPPPKYDLPVAMDKKPHLMHLENFFDAIYSGGKVALTCPAEVGYETAVAVLKVNEAVKVGRKLSFKSGEFKV